MYKVKVGNYVNFLIEGKLLLKDKNIVVRDFSEIIVPKNCQLILSKNVFIGRYVEIGARDIFIDTNSSIQNNCILLGNIKIGKNCLFGQNIYVSSGYHYFKDRPELLIHDQDYLVQKENTKIQKYITIEDDVWIGKNVVIINGVTISKGSIIGANTLVNKDVPPYSIVANTPQKIIGKRLDFEGGMSSALYGDREESFPYFYTGIDYSITHLKQNKYVTLCDDVFSVYLLNNEKYKKIYLELETQKEEVLVYLNQKIRAFKDCKIEFNIDEDNKFTFQILNRQGMIKIKKVYLGE